MTFYTSLVSRRTEVFRHLPCRGRLLEVATTAQLAELDDWSRYPATYTDVTQVNVDQPDWRAVLTTLATGYHDLAVLPGAGPLPWVLQQAGALLVPGGWVGVAAAGWLPAQLLTLLEQAGFAPLQAQPWGVGEGAYGSGRRAG